MSSNCYITICYVHTYQEVQFSCISCWKFLEIQEYSLHSKSGVGNQALWGRNIYGWILCVPLLELWVRPATKFATLFWPAVVKRLPTTALYNTGLICMCQMKISRNCMGLIRSSGATCRLKKVKMEENVLEILTLHPLKVTSWPKAQALLPVVISLSCYHPSFIQSTAIKKKTKNMPSYWNLCPPPGNFLSCRLTMNRQTNVIFIYVWCSFAWKSIV